MTTRQYMKARSANTVKTNGIACQSSEEKVGIKKCGEDTECFQSCISQQPTEEEQHRGLARIIIKKKRKAGKKHIYYACFFPHWIYIPFHSWFRTSVVNTSNCRKLSEMDLLLVTIPLIGFIEVHSKGCCAALVRRRIAAKFSTNERWWRATKEDEGKERTEETSGRARCGTGGEKHSECAKRWREKKSEGEVEVVDRRES
jgi:hypothetical protein